MPQLDKATFFTQIFWALFAYFFLYTLLSTYVCPAVGLTLKSRLRVDLGAGILAENYMSFHPLLKTVYSTENVSQRSSSFFRVVKKVSHFGVSNTFC